MSYCTYKKFVFKLLISRVECRIGPHPVKGMYVCMYASIYCMYVCMCASIYCMYVCMCASMYVLYV